MCMHSKTITMKDDHVVVIMTIFCVDAMCDVRHLEGSVPLPRSPSLYFTVAFDHIAQQIYAYLFTLLAY